MRLISWNVMQGGGSRIAAQIDVLTSRQPDTVVLQEVTLRTVAHYREQFGLIGLHYAFDSFELAPDRSVLTGPRCYGQLLASRWPRQSLHPACFPVPWTERVLSVVVSSAWGPLEVHTTHIPPGSSNGWLKIDTLEGIYRRLASMSDFPRVLWGDFNAPQEELTTGEIVTWGQSMTIGGYRTPRGKERWDRGERNVLSGLAPFDLPDVYRLLNGYEEQEYSWYWRAKGREIGRRFDHFFASRRLDAIGCRYLQAPRLESLGDHAPTEADFEPEGS